MVIKSLLPRLVATLKETVIFWLVAPGTRLSSPKTTSVIWPYPSGPEATAVLRASLTAPPEVVVLTWTSPDTKLPAPIVMPASVTVTAPAATLLEDADPTVNTIEAAPGATLAKPAVEDDEVTVADGDVAKKLLG